MVDLATIVGSGPVLCLAPHPDDESLGCGALLAACWRDGIPAHVACITDGAASHPGSKSWPPERLAALRRTEIEQAISILGGDPACDLTCLGHPDAGLLDLDPAILIREIGRLVDAHVVRTVLTPSARDPHCDHVATAAAAERVWRDTPGLRLLSYPIWSRWALGEETVSAGPNGMLHLFLDSRLAATKTSAIAAHASQRGAVVDDDPGGFVMPEGFAAMFTTGPEIFDEQRR